MARPESATKPRARKVAVVEEITTKLNESDAAVLTEYRGLTVSELAHLRGALRPAGTEYKVFKNTLARRAADAAGLTELSGLLEGPVAIAFVKGDAVLAAKALRDFAKNAPALVVKGGLLGTRVLSPHDITVLADVPPRDVLLARLAGGFQAPLTKTAGLLQAFTRNMAYGVKALIDQRIAAGEAAPAAAADEAPPAEDATSADETPADETPADDADAAPAESTESEEQVAESGESE